MSNRIRLHTSTEWLRNHLWLLGLASMLVFCLSWDSGSIAFAHQEASNGANEYLAAAAGEHDGSDDLDEETRQCIIDVLGYLPSSPDELTEEQKRQVGRECFGD